MLLPWLTVLKVKPFVHVYVCFGSNALCGLIKHQCDLRRAHSPSVQFLLSIMLPLQWRPPLRGGGAWHSRLRQCVHSVPHADHLAHSVQPPSTKGQHRAQWCRHNISYSIVYMKTCVIVSCVYMWTWNIWHKWVIYYIVLFCIYKSVIVSVRFTWTEGGAGDSLKGWALTKSTPIKWCRIGTTTCPSLPAPATTCITLWPLCPGWPASTHWGGTCTDTHTHRYYEACNDWTFQIHSDFLSKQQLFWHCAVRRMVQVNHSNWTGNGTRSLSMP